MRHRSLQLASAIFALAMVALAPGRAQAAPFAAAKIFIEFNSSAQDIGVQVFLDTDTAWKSLKAFDPQGRKILDVGATGNVGTLGVSEFFFESDEPPLAELPIDQFLQLFPEGQYTFVGETVGGGQLTGKAKFSHAIPAGPEVITPAPGSVQDPSNTVIA